MSADFMVSHLLAPLAPFLAQEDVADVAVHRPHEVWIKRDGWEREIVAAIGPAYLQSLALAICAWGGVAMGPRVSVTLPRGERAEVCGPPMTVGDGVVLCLRRHRSAVLSLDELAATGAFADWQERGPTAGPDPIEAQLSAHLSAGDLPGFLRAAVTARRNIVIAGRTGSGKTTLARALLDAIPADERIITLEDVHELRLDRPHHIALLHGTGAGRVSPAEALASCLRLAPDRLLLGELRGAEAWDYLQAIHTGHPGSITTVHANSAPDARARIATLARQSDAARGLGQDALDALLASALDVILYVERRRVVEVWHAWETPAETAESPGRWPVETGRRPAPARRSPPRKVRPPLRFP